MSTHRTFSVSFGAALVYLCLHPVSAQTLAVPSERIPSQSQIEDLRSPLSIAPSQGARPLTVTTISLIKDFEGWEPAAYDDPSGYCTIGYGHLIALQPCAQIHLREFANALTVYEGEILLEKDTRTARLAVQRLVTIDLTDEQFGALSSFAFNVGKENFAKSTLLVLLNANQAERASSEFGRWIKSKGKVLEGLVVRRNCEASLFRGQQLLDSNGTFRRQQCVSLGISPTRGPLIDIEEGE